MEVSPPQNPAGSQAPVPEYSEVVRTALIEQIRTTPAELRAAVSGLSDEQLNTLYRNWTIRQIVHHLADSHVNSYVRFKWAMAEENPTIKAYEEGDWALLEDGWHGCIQPSLLLVEGLHARWVQSLEAMTATQFARTFHHPQSGETVSLWVALNYYAWHSRHHVGQIVWLRESGMVN